MSEVDYDRIERIAKDASEISFTRMEQTIEKCIDRKFDSMGMGNPDKVRKIMIYGEQCMKDKQNIRRGFLTGIGGHLATVVISATLAWGVVRGWFG